MQLQLAEQTVKRVQALADPDRGLTVDSVINQALDCFEHGELVDPRGSLSSAELAASLERLAAAEASISAGRGLEAGEAIQRLAAKHGLPLSP